MIDGMANLGRGAVALGVIGLAAACGGSDATSGPGGPGPGGNGGAGAVPMGGAGAVPMGGAGAVPTGGAGAVPGGMGGAAMMGDPVTADDIRITGSVTQCAGTTPAPLPTDVTALACLYPDCQAATCIEKGLIQSFAPQFDDAALGLLATCGDPNVYCVPNDFIATTGDFQVKSCVSLEGAEGRCISTCVPQVAVQLNTLPQADCAPSERCAPCWNPIDGTNTGACDQGCDTGPTQPPVVFDECGNGAGVCVPSTLVTDPVQLGALQGVDDPTGICPDPSRVCAPKLKAANQAAPFPVCTMTSAAALLAVPNSTGQLAACVPQYIVPVAQQGLLLPDGCAPGELCAPCLNPLSMPANLPTGACPP